MSGAERVLAGGTVYSGRGISGRLTGGATAVLSSAAAAVAWPGAPGTSRRRSPDSLGRSLLARRTLGSGTHLQALRWTVPPLDASWSLIHTSVSSTFAVEAVSFFEMETRLGSALARFRVCAGVRERVPCARAAPARHASSYREARRGQSLGVSLKTNEAIREGRVTNLNCSAGAVK